MTTSPLNRFSPQTQILDTQRQLNNALRGIEELQGELSELRQKVKRFLSETYLTAPADSIYSVAGVHITELEEAITDEI